MRTKPTSTVCVIASPVVEDDESVADETADSDVSVNEASVVLLATVSVWARASDAAAASSRILSIMFAVVIMHVLVGERGFGL